MNGIKQLFFWSQSSRTRYKKAQGFFKRYETKKQSQDLEKAIENYSAAVEVRCKKGKSVEAMILIGYALALWTRYEQSPDRLEDLARVVHLYESAHVEWSTKDPKPEGYPILLLNLGNAYYRKATVARSSEHAEEALDNAVSILDELNSDSYTAVQTETRIKGMVVLGAALSRRCGQKHNTERLDEAIQHLENALNLLEREMAATENGGRKEQQEETLHTIRGLCYNNLATAYDTRYRICKPSNPQDLDRAIEYSRKVVEVLPSNHPDRGTSLYNLANQLYKRFKRAQKAGEKCLDAGERNERIGLQDLEDALKAAMKAQKLLRGTSRPNAVDNLVKVLRACKDALSKQTSKNDNGASTSENDGSLSQR